MPMESLHDLYVHELRDAYSAETQLADALVTMAGRASDSGLRKAFEQHGDRTREHARRLETIFESLEAKPDGSRCRGIEGLIREGDELAKSVDGASDVLDAGLVATAQRAEHYEMAVYGTLRAFAEKLGRKADAKLLQQTLDEEKETDRRLTELARDHLNSEALA